MDGSLNNEHVSRNFHDIRKQRCGRLAKGGLNLSVPAGDKIAGPTVCAPGWFVLVWGILRGGGNPALTGGAGDRRDGFVLSWTLEELQLLEGAVIGAAESAFVTDQQGEAVLVVGDVLKDPGEAMAVAHVVEFGVDRISAADELGAEQIGFNTPEAKQAPAGDGHGFDQIHFDGGRGVELVEVGLAEVFEVFLGLGGQDDGLRGESVAEAVVGRAGAAFEGEGASGFGAVGAGGRGFALRWHVAP